MKWFSRELYLPSELIDRGSLEAWKRKGSKSALERASERANQLLAKYRPSPISAGLRSELRSIAQSAARKFGMENLPPLETE
jgi:trimethylamine:corrinoid methyltransferase-like protein